MPDPVACRVCGMELPPDLRLIGICVWCVCLTSQAPPPLPRPRYGADGTDEADDGHEWDIEPQ
jgi:hypothetical protein